MPRLTGRHRPAVLTAMSFMALTPMVLLTSCGLSGTNPKSVTEDFISAMQEENWEAACAELSHDFIHRNMNGDSRYCVYYLEQWHGNRTTFDRMTIPSQDTETRSDGTLITVDLGDGSTDQARVVDEGGELKLARYPGQGTAAR